MPAIPAAAWLIVAARHRYLTRQSLANVAALLGSWLAFSGIVLALLVGVMLLLLPPRASADAFSTAASQSCLVPSAFTDLAGLAPERIMSPIDLGAHIMLYTPHAVVAAPYHRNQQGVRDAFRFFNEPIAIARSILAERGIGLVVICPAMPEMAGIPGRATDSFVNLYASDQLPGWLADVSLPSSPLKVYAVLP